MKKFKRIRKLKDYRIHREGTEILLLGLLVLGLAGFLLWYYLPQCFVLNTVLTTGSRELSKIIRYDNTSEGLKRYSERQLPEDIYVFDKTYEWYIAFTHGFLMNNIGEKCTHQIFAPAGVQQWHIQHHNVNSFFFREYPPLL